MNSAEPESPPSLKVLLEQARSPNAGRAEVDALLHGLEQSPRPGEEALERAELLRLILQDKRLRSFIGSKGRQVHTAAAQAMAALGEPYARELTPADRVAMHAAKASAPEPAPAVREEEAREPAPEEPTLRHWVGRVLLMGVGIVELYFIRFHIVRPGGSALGLMAFSLGTTFVPAWLAVSRKALAHRGQHLQYLTVVLLPCPPMALGALAFFVLGSSRPTAADYLWLFVPLGLAFARLVGAACLYMRPRK